MEIIKDEKIRKIVEKIEDAIKLTKFKNHVFLCGGCVRDSLLGITPHDVDVVVDIANGGIMLANLLAAREKCYAIGSNPVVFFNSGTAKVNLYRDKDLKDINIEFSQTRKSANVGELVGTIEEDSKLRDLSINSLYYNITEKKLYDFNQSIGDLIDKTIRTVNPNLVFDADPIKMLRVIRFSSQLGWGIEKDTWMGILANYNKIKKAPQEKISLEISKILTSNNASVGIRKLMYSGLLSKVMPDIYDLNQAYESRNPCVTSFDHTMKVLDTVQPLIENRLAALFHDVGRIVAEHNKTATQSQDEFSADIASSDLKAMKFSNEIIKSVENSIKYHRLFRIYADGITPPDKKIRKFINLCGNNIGGVIDLMNANNIHQTYDKKKRQVLDILNRIEELDEIEESKNVKLPIDGKDIMKHLGIKGSPTVGKLLDKVKDAYFENPKITKEECFELIDKEVKVLAV